MDLRPEPIEVRKRTLEGLLPREHRRITFNRHFAGEGPIIDKHACALGCDGIVSKRWAHRTDRAGRIAGLI
ncbi:MAG: hypothetical protein ABR973_16265 [Candidatus Acidiferrales bacterium]